MSNFQYHYPTSSTEQTQYQYSSNSFQPQTNFNNPISIPYGNPHTSIQSNYQQINHQYSEPQNIQTILRPQSHSHNHINNHNSIGQNYVQNNWNQQNKYISTSINRPSESFSENIIPIDEIEYRSRIATRNKEIVVYESEDSPFKMDQRDYTLRNETGLLKLNTASILDMEKRSRNRREREEAYNIYSCLDEPFERVKEFGCSGLTCPSNEFIARQTPEKDWFN